MVLPKLVGEGVNAKVQLLTEANRNSHEREPDEEQHCHFLRPEENEVKQFACHNLYGDDDDHAKCFH
ncbi:hypothetical protein SAMN04487897_101292 [Paenibacillus sp. yr247]|nr:hypothetical protein SAMN04487897_101292 [Paenibacillus sp. yr247]